MENMNYLRELLKRKVVNNDEDKKRIENLNFLLKDDNIFFNLDMETAYGILEFLGFDENNVESFYLELISPKSFIDNNKPYVTISGR